MDNDPSFGNWSAVEEIDLREYLAVLSRRRRVILASLAIVFIATLLSTLAKTPMYDASTMLQIEPDTPKILNFEDMFQVDATTDAFYQTQYRLIESRAVASQVIDQMGLLESEDLDSEGFVSTVVGAVVAVPRFGINALRSMLGTVPAGRDSADGPTEDDVVRSRAIDGFLGRMSVDPIRNTRLVSVSWSSPSPIQAAAVTRSIADTYIAMNLQAKYDTTLKATQFLAAEIDQLQTDLATAEAELQRYGTERNILSDAEIQDVVSQSLQQLNQELTRARADRVQKEATLESLRNSVPSSLAEVRSNRIVESLKQDLAGLRQQETEMARQFTADWPDLRRLQAQIADLETRIETEERAVYDSVVRQARGAFRAALDRESRVGGLMDEATGEATSLNQNLIVYRSLQTTIASKRSMLESLLERQSETGVSSRLQGQQTSSIRIVDAATVPLSTSSPNLRLNLMLGLIVGLMLGVGLAFVQEYLDNSLKTPEEVERHLGLPNLALVPSLSSLAHGKGAASYGYGGYGYAADGTGLSTNTIMETVARDLPRSAMAEAYRTLRTSVLLSRAGHPPQVVVVTSSQPGEGKTTSSINLAMSMAQAGKKTLLIDADLRKPRTHEILGLAPEHGLVSYLTGGDPIERVVHDSGTANLWVMPCGPQPPNPAELLGSPEVKNIMRALRDSFDMIIIDTPPILAVVDALEVAALADGVVLVVKGGETPHPIAERAFRKLRDVQAHVLGVVLNNVDLAKIGYYGTYSKGRYRFADREEKPAAEKQVAAL